MGLADRSIKIYGMAMFDGLVLEISFVEFNETSHASLYGYELIFIPSGVSVITLGVADDPLRSIFSCTWFVFFSRFLVCRAGKAKKRLVEPKLLYEFF